MTEFQSDPQEPPVGQPQPPRPRWATVIGVISIIWASLKLLCCGWASFLNNLWYFTMAEVVGFVAAFILFVGGIQLLRQRRWARRCLLLYGGITAAVLACVSVPFAIRVIPWILGAPPWREWEPELSASLAHAIFGFLISLAWPVFVLIWFNRPAIRRQMSDW